MQSLDGEAGGGVLHEQDVARERRQHLGALALDVHAEVDMAVGAAGPVHGEAGLEDVLDGLGGGDLGGDFAEELGGRLAGGDAVGLDGLGHALLAADERLGDLGVVHLRGRGLDVGGRADGGGALDGFGELVVQRNVGGEHRAVDVRHVAPRERDDVVVDDLVDDHQQLLAGLPRGDGLGVARGAGLLKLGLFAGEELAGRGRRLEDRGGRGGGHREEDVLDLDVVGIGGVALAVRDRRRGILLHRVDLDGGFGDERQLLLDRGEEIAGEGDLAAAGEVHEDGVDDGRDDERDHEGDQVEFAAFLAADAFVRVRAHVTSRPPGCCA